MKNALISAIVAAIIAAPAGYSVGAAKPSKYDVVQDRAIANLQCRVRQLENAEFMAQMRPDGSICPRA